MTALDDRPITTVTHPHPARHASPPLDVHARLRAEADRLLEAALARTEATAQEALANLVGSLLNTMPAGVETISTYDLLGVLRRTADRLGCPPAVVAAKNGRRGRR